MSIKELHYSMADEDRWTALEIQFMRGHYSTISEAKTVWNNKHFKFTIILQFCTELIN
jgi:hypothetical protein